MTAAPPDQPELVIVPAHPVGGPGHEVCFETREDRSGAAVLPVFSSVPALTAALGQAQPWIALPLARAREIAAAGGAGTVVVDPQVSPGAWRWDLDELQAAARHAAGGHAAGGPQREEDSR